ncbi:EAL domain-containing protein [Deltaproteobacteria bacterium TL4]
MESLFRFDFLFPFALPSIVSMLVCFFLASVSINSGRNKKENQLLTLYCLLQTLLSLNNLLEILWYSNHMALIVSRVIHGFYVFILPISFHFIQHLTEFSQEYAKDKPSLLSSESLSPTPSFRYPLRVWIVRLLYLSALALMPFTQTDYFILNYQPVYYGRLLEPGSGYYLFSLVSLLSLFYGVWILLKELRITQDPTQLRQYKFIVGGAFLYLCLSLVKVLPLWKINIFPLAHFMFLPMVFLAYGVLENKIVTTIKSWLTEEGHASTILIALTWTPPVICVILWFKTQGDLFYSNILQHLFPLAIPSLLSLLTCLVIATFSFSRKKLKLEILLFGILSVLWGWFNLDVTLLALVLKKDMALYIGRVDHFFLMLNIGIYSHFIYLVIRRQQRIFVYSCYFISFILMGITQTDHYFYTVKSYYFGVFAQADWGILLFAGIAFMSLLWYSYLIHQSWENAANVQYQKKLSYIFIGVILSSFLNFGNLPAVLGFELYPLGTFIFVPNLLMTFGMFRHNLVKINVYARRRMVSNLIQAVILLGFLVLIPLSVWALEGFTVPYIMSRLIPYGIPPLLSLLCCALLSFISLRVGKNQKDVLLFSLICMVYAFLNCDILLNGIITLEEVGLRLSRMSHLSIVFLLALYLHLVFTITKQNKHWWVVYGAYGFGAILSPLTQTSYYIKGMYHYYWGFFAKKAFLFDVFGGVILAGVGFGIWILYRSSQKTDNPFQQHRLRYLFLGLLCSAFFNLSNIPPMYGLEIYPLGNFTFIPMLLFAYGMFRYNFKEAINSIHQLFLWIGIIATLWLLSLSPGALIKTDHQNFIKVLEVIVIWLSFTRVQQFWQFLLGLFFGQHAEEITRTYKQLIDRLSKTNHLLEIYQTLTEPILNTFMSQRFVMLVGSDSLTQFWGWETWSSKEQTLFFSKKSHEDDRNLITIDLKDPLLTIFETYPLLRTQEEMEEWILNQPFTIPAQHQLRDATLLLPVFFEERLTCLLLIFDKIDGTLYSQFEKQFFRQLGLVLGPYINNAELLQGIESQNRKLENHIEELFHDPLTRCWNQRKFIEDLENTKYLTSLYLRIINFSEINSGLNFEAGDEALRQMADTLKPLLSEGAMLYRLAGPEFCVLLPENLQKGTELSGVIKTAINDAKINYRHLRLILNLSIGIADRQSGDMYKNAHVALGQSQKSGKIEIYTQELQVADEHLKTLQQYQSVQEGFEENAFFPVFQGIRDNRKGPSYGKINKYECLMRLQTPEKVLAPFFFLAALERSGSIARATKLMIMKSFDHMSQTSFEFSINLTEKDLVDEGTFDFIQYQLEGNHIDPKRVTFEILEGISSNSYNQITIMLDRLKTLGCKIAIDDFGAELSNIGRLLNFEPDYIKIDAKFIKNLPNDSKSRIIVENIYDLATRIGAEVVAEFVESQEIQNIVEEIGIHYSQGYLYSQPSKTTPHP